MAEKTLKKSKNRTGIVVSDKMNKTAIVSVERRSAHPVFKKIITTSKRYYVHDENNQLNIGDRVRIVETRPLSKLKRWRLGELLEKGRE